MPRAMRNRRRVRSARNDSDEEFDVDEDEDEESSDSSFDGGKRRYSVRSSRRKSSTDLLICHWRQTKGRNIRSIKEEARNRGRMRSKRLRISETEAIWREEESDHDDKREEFVRKRVVKRKREVAKKKPKKKNPAVSKKKPKKKNPAVSKKKEGGKPVKKRKRYYVDDDDDDDDDDDEDYVEEEEETDDEDDLSSTDEEDYVVVRTMPIKRTRGVAKKLPIKKKVQVAKKKPKARNSNVSGNKKGRKPAKRQRRSSSDDDDWNLSANDEILARRRITRTNRTQTGNPVAGRKQRQMKMQKAKMVAEPEVKKVPNRKVAAKDKGKRKETATGSTSKKSCAICLRVERKRIYRGYLNSCSHYFCFECIMEWSKVESRCPMCKKRFTEVTRSATANVGSRKGSIAKNIPVIDQVYEPTEEELQELLDPYADVVCIECNQDEDEHLLLLCDICDLSSHTYCVGLGINVPDGDWFCSTCTPLPIWNHLHNSAIQNPLPLPAPQPLPQN